MRARSAASAARASSASENGRRLPGDLLVGLVALAGDAAPRRASSAPAMAVLDRARRDRPRPRSSAAMPSRICVDDRERILAARVVGGDDHAVGEARGDRAHQRALGRVAVAAGAEHDREAPAARCARPAAAPAAPSRARPACARSRPPPAARSPTACMRPGTGGSVASSARASANGMPMREQAAEHAERIRDIEAPDLAERRRGAGPSSIRSSSSVGHALGGEKLARRRVAPDRL